jgi:hypothetical protein
LQEAQRALTILPEANAMMAALNANAKLCQKILVENIRNREFRMSLSATRRLFNAVTGLKRELRTCLRLYGEPVGGVDIRCAQPALLAVLMGWSGGKNVPTYILSSLVRSPVPVASAALDADWFRRERSSGVPGLRRALSFPGTSGLDSYAFRELSLSGGLYESLVSSCQRAGVALGEYPRDRVKTLLLQEVLAKRGCYPSDFEDVFAEKFPSVWRFVRWVNAEDYRELIRALQRLESWLVIEEVAPRLVDHVPVVTLHDAIYGRVSDLDRIREGFEETFADLGIRLATKTEGMRGEIGIAA